MNLMSLIELRPSDALNHYSISRGLCYVNSVDVPDCVSVLGVPCPPLPLSSSRNGAQIAAGVSSLV